MAYAAFHAPKHGRDFAFVAVSPASASEADDAAQMQLHGITYDGEKYHFGEYRYGNLSDAVAYAVLQGGQAERLVCSCS